MNILICRYINMSILEVDFDTLQLILDVASWKDILTFSSTCAVLNTLHDNILHVLRNDLKHHAKTNVYHMCKLLCYDNPLCGYSFCSDNHGRFHTFMFSDVVKIGSIQHEVYSRMSFAPVEINIGPLHKLTTLVQSYDKTIKKHYISRPNK